MALVLIVGWVAYSLRFGGDRDAVLTVVAVSGSVERTTAAGAAVPAAPGDALDARERIEVGPSGQAILSVGESTRLQLEPDSSIEVVEVSPEGVQVELEDGRIQARVRSGAPRLVVSSGERTVSTEDADFTVGADGGALAVEVTRGGASVDGPSGTTSVSSGEVATMGREGAPVMSAADAALLLEVRWPEAPGVRTDAVVLAGETGPFARVGVAGRPAGEAVQADAQGRFELRVPLGEGVNAIEVVAIDPLGASVRVDGRVTRDSRAPGARSVQVSWGG